MSELSDKEYDSVPELIWDPDSDRPNDERPVNQAELIYTTIDEGSTAPENPKSLKEMHNSPEWSEWEKAIQTELEQLEHMETWELVDLPEGRSAIDNKWVFVCKYGKDGKLEKYKARRVAKAYSQKPGMDYTDTFSPVVRLETI